MPLFTSAEAWLNAHIKQPSQSGETFEAAKHVLSEDNESWVVSADRISSHCPLDSHLNLGTSAPARHSLGELEKLPNELIAIVLLSADIPSLMVFRRVNRRAMQTVDSIPEYATIIKKAPEVISAVLSVEANTFDLKHLYSTVREPKCSICHQSTACVTAYLYLIDCRRICFMCYYMDPKLLPCILNYAATPNDPGKTLQLDQKLPETQYPSILGLPFFSSSARDVPEELRGLRVRLFDRRAVGQKAYVAAEVDDIYCMRRALKCMTVMESWPI